jgi:ribonuclease HI
MFISAPDTTNNRMALSGAIATLALLLDEHERLSVIYVSDSQYLIKGINEWVPNWRARGWRRKGGQVENLELWKRLDMLRGSLGPSSAWCWVRGHAGNPKNEYVNDLAIEAARGQHISDGAVDSQFLRWLDRKQSLGRYLGFEPDKHVIEIEA